MTAFPVPSLSTFAHAGKGLLLTACVLTLAACAGGRVAPPASTYDFGPPAKAQTLPVPLTVDLRLAPWLDTAAISYRLAYEDASRLAAYHQSRWVAPAGQLLALRWRQQLGGSGGQCLLRIEVDEFTQVFNSPEGSRGVLQGRMTLWDKQRKLLLERSLSVEKAAPSADARGGVVALTQAADAAAADAAAWLGGAEQQARLSACR